MTGRGFLWWRPHSLQLSVSIIVTRISEAWSLSVFTNICFSLFGSFSFFPLATDFIVWIFATIILCTFNFFQNSVLHIARSLHSPFYSTFPSSSVSPNQICLIVYCHCSVAKLCLSLCDAMDCRPPGSSVHEISQARILEWVAIPSPYLDLFHLLKSHGKYAQKYLIEVHLLELSSAWILQYPSP